jgi:hypothetical protein
MVRPQCVLLGVAGFFGCRGEGTWEVTATGGRFAEQGMTTGDFDDQCAAVFQDLEVVFHSVDLRDEDGESGGGIEVASPLNLATDGPHTVGIIDVLEGDYDTFVVQLGDTTTPAFHLAGVLTCNTGTTNFDWTFEGPLRSTCETGGVSMDNKGDDSTAFVLYPEAIFATSSSGTSVSREGVHLLRSDLNVDGILTLDELEQVMGDDAGLEPGAVPTDLRTHVTEQVFNMVTVEGGSTCTMQAGG